MAPENLSSTDEDDVSGAFAGGLIGGVVAAAVQTVISATPARPVAGVAAAAIGGAATAIAQTKAARDLVDGILGGEHQGVTEAMARPPIQPPEWDDGGSAGAISPQGIVDPCMPDPVRSLISSVVEAHVVGEILDDLTVLAGGAPTTDAFALPTNGLEAAFPAGIDAVQSPATLSSAGHIVDGYAQKGLIVDPADPPDFGDGDQAASPNTDVF